MRADGRAFDELRSWTLQPGFTRSAPGSVLVQAGGTRVICTAGVNARAPSWLESGGWVTAEYSMLPGATHPRGRRDPGGRGKEIMRLIGRSLRASVDLSALVDLRGEAISIVCDCDVIDADGGTRTAAITGASVALQLALRRLVAEGQLAAIPQVVSVAAVSVGIVNHRGAPVAMLDLPYVEDKSADVDFNVVQLAGGGLVELQGAAERSSFSRDQLAEMLDLARAGIDQLLALQRQVLDGGGDA